MKAKPILLLTSLLALGIGALDAGEPGGGDEGRLHYHESQMPGRYRQWRATADGRVAAHLTAEKTTFASAAEGITLRCVVRNHSDKAITILSPFGDTEYAHTTGLNVLGPDGPVAYDGPQTEYALGRDAFVELPAQSVTEGALTIPKERFPGIEKPGLYVVDYGYVSRGYPAQQPPANFWTGGVQTNPVTIMVK